MPVCQILEVKNENYSKKTDFLKSAVEDTQKKKIEKKTVGDRIVYMYCKYIRMCSAQSLDMGYFFVTVLF